jgi:hypothetical protein
MLYICDGEDDFKKICHDDVIMENLDALDFKYNVLVLPYSISNKLTFNSMIKCGTCEIMITRATLSTYYNNYCIHYHLHTMKTNKTRKLIMRYFTKKNYEHIIKCQLLMQIDDVLTEDIVQNIISLLCLIKK